MNRMDPGSTVDSALDDLRRLGLLALLDVLSGRPGERPEDVLLDLKLVDDHALALALAVRSGRPFAGLRHVTVDHRLFLYLPLHLAQRERVVPLGREDDCLTVASAYLDPDLSSLAERFPSLEVRLVVSPRVEVLEALQRVGA
jgi:Type II secretion system (T2SS), protein E, N-terminal domain